MKKKKVIKKVFAVIMALSVIFSYSVVAMADEEKCTNNLICTDSSSDHIHTDACYGNHVWDSGEVKTESTCTSDGEKTFTCTVEGCRATKTESIPADHSWDEGTITTEPTCITEGVKTFTCTVDGCDGKKIEVIPALGHEFGTDGKCIHEGCKESITINSDTVALIGNVQYKTLDAAVEAASSGATIVLLKDQPLTKVMNKDITFTGKGAISVNDYTYNNGFANTWVFDGSGISFTWTNGSDNWLMWALSKGTLRVTNGARVTFKLDSTTTPNNCALYVTSDSKIEVMNGSTFEIYGKTETTTRGQGIQSDDANGTKITVTGGSTFLIDGTNRGYVCSPDITVENSTFTVQNCTSNASNGGYFKAVNSTVNFLNNLGHGLSATYLTSENSKFYCNNNAYYGITSAYSIIADGKSVINANGNGYGFTGGGMRLAKAAGVGQIASGAEVNICENKRNGLENYGNFTFEDGVKLNITKNTNNSDNGGGIFNGSTGVLSICKDADITNNFALMTGGGMCNAGKIVLSDNVSLYNNHAGTAGDDIYNRASGSISFNATGSDWVLDDCGHKITGWYYDDIPYIAEMSDSEPQLLSVGDGYNGGRWSVKGCEILDPVSGTASKAEVTNAYEYAETAAEGVIALKAAHGVPALPPYIPVTPESVYTVTYMDGVDDEVVFEDQSTTNLKKGDKTPAFTGEPVREGYKFIGWSPEVAETVTGDAVYYAQWEKLPEEPSVVDPSGDNDPIDDGNDIDAQPNGDADTDVEAKGVKTGDETMLAMWGALGLIAALGLGGALVIGRRREE